MAAIAPMEVYDADDVASIPLECILCPKNPRFSDISHLLTHVSSKSHLHQKFNLEFKAKTENGARQRLRLFEDWYEINGIEELLSERLAMKNGKNGKNKTSRRGRFSTSSARSRKSTSTVDSLRIDIEAPSGYHTPDHISHQPHASQWGDVPHGLSIRDGYADESGYQTPISHEESAYYYYDDVPSNMRMRRSSVVSDVDTSLSLDTMDEANGNKLKGVIWPGMNIFDAATPAQKRKRNQRKDCGVIEQMKLTSESVSAVETVWGPNGDIRKVRDIYASPSVEGSPPGTPLRRKRNRQSANTPTKSSRSAAASRQDVTNRLPKTKRGGRQTASNTKNSRLPKAAPKNTRASRKKTNITNAARVEESHSLPMGGPVHNNASFDVFYEGTSNQDADDVESHIGELVHDNGFSVHHQHGRPALQSLDPNLNIMQSDSFFKNSPPSRFFNGMADTHLSFRSQASSYGSAIHGLCNNSLTTLSSQPRNGALYSTLDNQFFVNDDEAVGAAFSSAGQRRSGFEFGMDTNTGPFGFSDHQHDGSIREPFPDQSLHTSAEIFEI